MALHGFLGSGEDWSREFSFISQRPSFFQEKEILAPGPELEFSHWAEEFCQNQLAYQEVDALIGYSMGGRLALHLCERNPSRWKKLVLISTHLGLQSDEEREKRILHDRRWAQRFRQDPWSEVLRDWNDQGVFKGDEPGPLRDEEGLSRERLALALENWSTGRQKDFRSFLRETSVSIRYIVGEKDQKYLQLAQELSQLNPRIEVSVIEDRGHRLIFK